MILDSPDELKAVLPNPKILQPKTSANELLCDEITCSAILVNMQFIILVVE